MGATFVDPRDHPVPPAANAGAIAETMEGVGPLVAAINGGRVYEVEKWIKGGEPIQFRYPADRRRSPTSPLQAAIQTGQHDVVHLLLCNGYQLDLERFNPLDEALKCHRRDLVELLLTWGADPNAADPSEVVSSYDAALVERFWRLGVDLSRGRAFAEELAYTPTNKPLYGFFKRFAKEDPALQLALNHGLCLAVEGLMFRDEGGEAAVALCRWAGAEPFACVPDPDDEDDDDEECEGAEGADRHRWSPYRCAAGLAVSRGRLQLLEAMKLRADSPHFQRLYEVVDRPDVYDFLFDLEPPRNPEAVAHRALAGLGFDLSYLRANPEGLFKRVLERGGRLTSIPDSSRRQLQAHLRKHSGFLGRDLVQILQDPAKVKESVFLQIIQSPKLIEFSKELRIPKQAIEKVAALETASSSVRAAARKYLGSRRRRRGGP